MFKKWDVIIIIILLVVSFIPQIIFGFILRYNYDMTYVEVTVGGNFYSKIPLSAHKGEDIIEINFHGHINKVVIRDDTITMIEADCPDLLCIYQGEISKVGQSLVCLPNKVMVEIKGNKIEDDDIIISH